MPSYSLLFVAIKKHSTVFLLSLRFLSSFFCVELFIFISQFYSYASVIETQLTKIELTNEIFVFIFLFPFCLLFLLVLFLIFVTHFIISGAPSQQSTSISRAKYRLFDLFSPNRRGRSRRNSNRRYSFGSRL